MANDNYQRYLEMLQREGIADPSLSADPQEDLLLKQIEDQSDLSPQPEYNPDASLFERAFKQNQNAISSGAVNTAPSLSPPPTNLPASNLSPNRMPAQEAPAPQAAAPISAPQQELYDKDLTDEAIKEAQKFRQQGKVVSLAARAGDLIGRGISGAKSDPEFSKTLDAVEAAHAAKAQDIFERRKGKDEESRREKLLLELSDDKAMSDPNSTVSIAAREQMTKIVPEYSIPSNISAKQLRELGYNMGSLLNVKESGEARIASAKERASLDRERNEERKKQRDIQNLTRYQTDFNKDKLVVAANEGLQSALDAERLLDSKTPISDEAVKTSLAKLSGERGVLTEQDIARFGGSKAITEKIAQSTRQMVDGKLTEANRGYMRDIIQTFKIRRQQQLDERALNLSEQGSKRFDIPVEEAYDYLRPGAPLPEKVKATDERVKVRSPKGQVGSIPKAQLEKAIKQGYTQVE